MGNRSLNAANLETSKRLQDVFWILADGEEYSTLQLITLSTRCAINSIIAELRDNQTTDNGLTIHCKRRDDVWYYRMEINDICNFWRLKLRLQEAS